MTDAIDYRHILKRYIDHVVSCEGINFLFDGHGVPYGLSLSELHALFDLAYAPSLDDRPKMTPEECEKVFEETISNIPVTMTPFMQCLMQPQGNTKTI